MRNLAREGGTAPLSERGAQRETTARAPLVFACRFRGAPPRAAPPREPKSQGQGGERGSRVGSEPVSPPPPPRRHALSGFRSRCAMSRSWR